MDLPHEGKYNIQGIQMHLYSSVKQVLFQYLKSLCSGGEEVGDKRPYSEKPPTK